MDWTQDQIAAVVGSQQLEIIGLRMNLAQALARIQELESPQQPANVVPIKEEPSGGA